MPIKEKDRSVKPTPTCYQGNAHGPVIGIEFELSRKMRLFAPYSFMSHAQMTGEEEISFYYTFGVVRVKGRHLLDIYNRMGKHELVTVKPSEPNDPTRDKIEVVEIVFEDMKADIAEKVF